ncbi:hypothetical protein HBI56_103090 [Parastagonospora nodorum]|nr:hypothetical protein HBH56_135800 [Parastagonospora nodorum]KAH3927171.1 hypothetical protein HBH54_157490 [Parastagonospora nodorum]KAH3949313.1 hypothetical protein HBH53_090940 [Parastagonospora nodorum]KAH3956514.1 hypothetical protein HBH51_240410 [Parastagonospora nodorum]KAH3974720.1 hypothetical protein HBH52_130820 [Parastagonospora nodorum]
MDKMRIFPANTTNVRYEIPWNEQDDDISMPGGFEDYPCRRSQSGFELEGSKKQAWGFELNAQFASLRPHRVSVASADGEDGGQMHLVMLDDGLLILCVPDELLPEGRRGDGDTTFVGIKQQLEWDDEEYDSDAPWYMNNEGEEHYDPDGQVRELIGMMKEHFREQRDRVS